MPAEHHLIGKWAYMSAQHSDIVTRHRDLIANEFAYLPAEAAERGVPMPDVCREALSPSGGAPTVSALRWHGAREEIIEFHGAALNAHAWDSVNLLLGLPALAVDMPGHGDSDWNDDFDYGPERLADALAPVVAGASGKVTLLGHSLGGLTAIELAARFPDRISGLVVVDITPSRRRLAPGSARIREFVQGPESYGSYEEIVERARQTGMGRDREQLERGVVLNTRRRPDGRIKFKHHLASPPAGQPLPDPDMRWMWSRLESVAVPVALVYGNRGLVDAAQLDEFRRRMPAAAIFETDAGHNVQRDAPQTVADAVRHVRQHG